MNTIIYFYNKDLREPVIEAKTEAGPGAPLITDKTAGQEYLLIRVGLCLKGEEWFGQSVGQNMPPEQQALLETQTPETPYKKGILGLLQRARKKRQEERHREQMQRLLEQLLSAREEQLKAVREQMQLTAERILKKVDREGECGYVCGEDISRCAAWQTWLKCFPVKEFDSYLQSFWAGQLLPRAVHPRFVILGACEGIDSLIECCAHRMKALRWILREKECSQEIMDFVEEFCVEYGLAIDLQTLPGRAAYRRMQLTCPVPANILDFTGEPCIATSGVARESIWLDMRSSEEKRRRIAGRDTGIRYYSLREKWRRM